MLTIFKRSIVLFFLVLKLICIIPTHAAMIRAYSCNNINTRNASIDIPLVEAYYDPDNTGLVYYSIEAQMRDGKTITDIDENTNKFSTLHVETKFLSGRLVNQYFRLCNHLKVYSGSKESNVVPDFNKLAFNSTFQNICPLTPNEKFNIIYVQNLSHFPSLSSYSIRFSIISNNEQSNIEGCAESYIAPEFDSSVTVAICLLIPIVFLFVTVVNMIGQLFSPFQEGSLNCFLYLVSAICNEAYLRHLSPSIPDILQYLQFAFFNGGLNLLYPAYYQPLLNLVNWCGLLTYDLLDSETTSTSNANNHLYLDYYNEGLSGITIFSGQQLRSYGWKSFMLWSLVALAVCWSVSGVVIVACWLIARNSPLYDREFMKDFWKKNLCVFIGNCIATYYIFFSLPFLVLSLYQFYAYVRNQTGANASASISGMVLVMFWIVGLVAFLTTYVFKTHLILGIFNKEKYRNHKITATVDPSKKLYTSVKIINMFGQVYYQYKPSKLNFIAYDYFLLFLKAIVISCIQSSGAAQVILLICIELAYFVLLLTFKPYYVGTNKNLNSLIISVAKIIVVFMNIPFIKTLGFSERTRSIVGYFQLCIHALLLLIIFFRSVSTLLDILMSRHRVKDAIEKVPKYPIIGKGSERNKINSYSRSSLSGGNSIDMEKTMLLNNNNSASINNSDQTVTGNSSNNNVLSGNGGYQSRRSESSLDTRTFFRQPQTLLLGNDVQTPSATHLNNKVYKDRKTDSLFTRSSMQLDTFDIRDSYDPLLSPVHYSRKKNVDYSVREADLYRGLISEPESEIQKIWNKRDGNFNSVNPMTSADLDNQPENEVNSNFASNVSRLFKKIIGKKSPPKSQESGFQVSRPKQLVVRKLSEIQIPQNIQEPLDKESSYINNIFDTDSLNENAAGSRDFLSSKKIRRQSKQDLYVLKKRPDLVDSLRNSFDTVNSIIRDNASDSKSSHAYFGIMGSGAPSASRAASYVTLPYKTKDNYHDTIHEVPEESVLDKSQKRLSGISGTLTQQGSEERALDEFDFEKLERKSTDYYSLKS